jgi:hypothetical protein
VGWPVNRISTETAVKISAVGLVADLVIALSTALPGAPVIPQWPQFVLFLGVFVVLGRGMPVGWSRIHRVSVRDLSFGRSLAVGLGVSCLIAVAAIVIALSIIHIGGQPEHMNGRYILNDHGVYIPISRAAYRHGLVLQQRIFTLIPAFLYLAGLAANTRAARR